MQQEADFDEFQGFEPGKCGFASHDAAVEAIARDAWTLHPCCLDWVVFCEVTPQGVYAQKEKGRPTD